MKKTLLIAGIAAAVMMSTTLTYAAETTAAADIKTKTPNAKPMPSKNCKDFKGQRPPKTERPNLDERLKLTEEQKQKAHEIRMDGHKKMKPIFQKMKVKKDELKKVEESNLSQDKKSKKAEALRNDLKQLKQEAKKIRMENTKQFEAILTDEQKAEFEKVKQEGRERAKKHHKGNHPRPDGAHKPSQNMNK